MSDKENLKSIGIVKKTAFLKDYQVKHEHLRLGLLFDRWIDSSPIDTDNNKKSDYDALDMAIAYCAQNNISIKGQLLQEIARAANHRIAREHQISNLYRTGKSKVTQIEKEQVKFEAISRVFQLIGMCGLDDEEACCQVSYWYCKKHGITPLATTIHNYCKEWLKKHKSRKLDPIKDKVFIDQFGKFDRVPDIEILAKAKSEHMTQDEFQQWLNECSEKTQLPDRAFHEFINSHLNYFDKMVALSSCKLWNETERERAKNNILDGFLALNEEEKKSHRGSWKYIEWKISYNGTKFVQSPLP
ncbi:hypothetical protein P0F39_001992 [Vibrio metschnikovii]|nr:hypothetical protein [Vibrio metschnikovii]EKO3887508.1 hypothetical protein [Vibrio metschnikovii]EKO3936040.1 hypothetical protein [Vibrio metschnikovii]